MSILNALSFLGKVCQKENTYFLEKGFQWFQFTFLPILNQASSNFQEVEAKEEEDKEILVESWLLTGEVYELLNAPLQALSAYQKTIHLDDNNPEGYHLIALLSEQLGDYIMAQQNINLAIKYAPEVEELMWDRQRIQDCMVYDKTPEFSTDHPYWKYWECLAANQAEKVITALRSLETEDSVLWRCLFRAYAMQGKQEKSNVVWKEIQDLDSAAVLDEVDRFYLL